MLTALQTELCYHTALGSCGSISRGPWEVPPALHPPHTLTVGGRLGF